MKARSSAHLFKVRIEALLAARGWKARDLGDRIGIAQSAIYRWIDGTGAPSLDALDRVASEFGTTTSELIADEGDSQESNIPTEVKAILEAFKKEDWAALMPTLRGIIAGKELEASKKSQKLRKSRA